MTIFRPFGAWTLQRHDEKKALKSSPVFLRTKKMSREEKRKAREVEEEKRRASEKKRGEVEEMAQGELQAANGNGKKHQKEQHLPKKRSKEQKNIARKLEEQKSKELEDNYLRSEREEKRRLRIVELAMAKV